MKKNIYIYEIWYIKVMDNFFFFFLSTKETLKSFLAPFFYIIFFLAKKGGLYHQKNTSISFNIGED